MSSTALSSAVHQPGAAASMRPVGSTCAIRLPMTGPSARPDAIAIPSIACAAPRCSMGMRAPTHVGGSTSAPSDRPCIALRR